MCVCAHVYVCACVFLCENQYTHISVHTPSHVFERILKPNSTAASVR